MYKRVPTLKAQVFAWNSRRVFCLQCSKKRQQPIEIIKTELSNFYVLIFTLESEKDNRRDFLGYVLTNLGIEKVTIVFYKRFTR